jgi:hypothetical protein
MQVFSTAADLNDRKNYEQALYKELKPISESFQEEALRINGLNRSRLCVEGELPEIAMTEASRWVKTRVKRLLFCMDRWAMSLYGLHPVSQTPS